MVSLKDIAKECQVSVATVSKALNDHADIIEERKKMIREKAEEMGYRPNLFARTLKPVLFYQDKGKKHKDCEPMMEKAKELLGKLGELAESKK